MIYYYLQSSMAKGAPKGSDGPYQFLKLVGIGMDEMVVIFLNQDDFSDFYVSNADF